MTARVDLHALIPNQAGSMVVADDEGRLPAAGLDLPPDRPAIGAVIAHLRSELGLDTPVLEAGFRWDAVADGDPIPSLVVVEPPPAAWQPPTGLGWLPIDGTPAGLPAPISERADEWLAELRTGRPPPTLRPRWARPGWYGRATTWATAQLRAVDRPPTGRFEQTYLRGFSALLRAPTDAGDVYLKAVFPLLHHEARVSQLLEERLPGTVAHVLGVEPDEGWLLMDDLKGGVVRERQSPAALRLGLETLVTIQRRLADDLEPFLAAGCPARPIARLGDDLGAALADPEVHSGRSPDRIATLVERVGAAAERVDGLPIPKSIVHGDFHNGNVVVRDDRAIVFDWSDAAIGSPVVDLVTWLWELSSDDDKAAAIDAWLGAWADVAPPDDVRARIDDILAVGAAYQVVSYVEIIRNLEPATRYSLWDAFELFLGQLDDAVP